MSESNLVVCEVTGRQVPADETVVLNGKRVCAEGKALLLEQMKSGETNDTQLHPGFSKRWWAMVVDGLVIGAPTWILTAVATASIGMANGTAENKAHQLLLSQEIISVVMAAASIAYIVLMHGTKGQTLGKMACKIKVVTDDTLVPITMRQSLLRGLWYQGPQLLFAILGTILILVLANTNAAFIPALGVIPGLYILVSVILALSDSAKQRTAHDRLAKTRVVRVSGLQALQTQASFAQTNA